MRKGRAVSRKNNFVKAGAKFVKFGVVGVINNVISLVVYYVIIFFNQELYLIGNVLGFFISTLNAYFMNSRFVFAAKDKTHSLGRLIRTYAVYVTSLCISTLMLYVLVQKLGISRNIAPVFALMVTVPFNFVMNQIWVYAKRDKNR